MPGLLDMLNAGEDPLAGAAPSGLLSPEQQNAARRQALLTGAAQLMSAGGWSPQRTTFGQALGPAIIAGQNAQQQAINSSLQAALIAKQLKEKKVTRPVAVLGPDGKTPIFVNEEDAVGRQPVPSRENNIPSAVSEWQFYNALNPKDQARYLQMKRAEQFRLGEVNGVQTAVTAGAGAAPGAPAITATPLTSLQQEAAAKAELARQGAAGAQLGEAQGKIAGGIQTKGANAQSNLGVIDEAAQLIPGSTGSVTGAAVDKLAGAFGHATEGAKSIAKLKVLQSNLMLSMPRMEGPQSDRDVQLYREAAGQIGDPTVPDDIKSSALATIRDLQTKYSDRAANAGAPSAVGVPKAAPKIRRYNPQTGKIE